MTNFTMSRPPCCAILPDMKRRYVVMYSALSLAAIFFLGCSTATEDPAKTARFASFFRDILADRVPSQDLTDKMKAALTPPTVNQIRTSYSSLGVFQRLQFLGSDSLEGYDRYHYAAMFTGGKRAVMFVLDSRGKIAGFFNE